MPMADVHMLPGLSTTPRVFIERLVEHADKIEAIACVVQWNKDENGNPHREASVFSTQMTLELAAWLRFVFDRGFPE